MLYFTVFLVINCVVSIQSGDLNHIDDEDTIIALIKATQVISRDKLVNFLQHLVNLEGNDIDEILPECNGSHQPACLASRNCTYIREDFLQPTNGEDLPSRAKRDKDGNAEDTSDPPQPTFPSTAYSQLDGNSDREDQLSSTISPEKSSTVGAVANMFLNNANQSNEKSEQACYIIHYSSLIKNTTSTPPKNKALHVWGFGFLSVAIISLSGVVGAIFIPVMKKRMFKIIMRYLVGLGIGTLSSTAIFQLIPECFELKRFKSDYLISSLIIWFSIWIFFIFESVCKIILSRKDKNKNRAKPIPVSRKNSILHVNTPPAALEAIEQDSFLPVSFDARWKQQQESESTANEVTVNSLHGSLHTLPYKKPMHHHSHDYLASGKPTISSVAWMIILGDGLHNFIDGVSIGAGFTENTMTGFSISIAIMCEEFPHELGDFAILIHSGMSVKRALLFNFASACTAFAGLILGISLESFEINTYIFGFAGGLFLYISLADLIPQLNEMIDEALILGTKPAWLILIQQNLGILSGMIILLLISKYSDNLKIV